VNITETEIILIIKAQNGVTFPLDFEPVLELVSEPERRMKWPGNGSRQNRS
jgi:hypothetical protein